MSTHPALFTSAFDTPSTDSPWSAGRALAVALVLTVGAAGLGFGVSWLSETERAAPERDALPTLLAYSRSSARVSGDLGAP